MRNFFMAFLVLFPPLFLQHAFGNVPGLVQINPTNNTIIGTITVPFGDELQAVGPHTFAIAQVSGTYFAYVLNTAAMGASTPGVSVVNLSTNTVTTTISDASFNTPLGIAINGGTAYIANANGPTISVIDLTSNLVTTVITSSYFVKPVSIAIDSSTNTAYVTNNQSAQYGFISIDLLTNTVNSPSPHNQYNTAIDIALYPIPNPTFAYVTNGPGNDIVEGILPFGAATQIPSLDFNNPVGIAIQGTNAYVTNFNAGPNASDIGVVVIDLTSNTVSATITDPTFLSFNGPLGIAILNNTAYVTNFNSDNATVIDLNTNTVITSISSVNLQSPAGIVADTINNVIYVNSQVQAPAPTQKIVQGRQFFLQTELISE